MKLEAYKPSVFDKALFEAWLESKQPEESVGNIYTTRNCPIATYIRETTGMQCSVGYTTCRPLEEYVPAWATSFMHTAHDMVRGRLDLQNDVITSAQALDILVRWRSYE